MNNFIYSRHNVDNLDHYTSKYNDYGLMCEITALAPQKYRVEILGYDSLLVESFICNTYEECGKEALEEAKWIKEYNRVMAGNCYFGEYELHHSWAGADISCLEKLKADAESYFDNYLKCEFSTDEPIDLLPEMIKQDKKDKMSERIKQIAKSVTDRRR